MKKNKQISFADLPDEVQELIVLSEKDYRIRKKFGLVCKKWNGFVTSPYALATYGLFKKDDELKKTALSIPYQSFRNELFSGKASQQQIETAAKRIKPLEKRAFIKELLCENKSHGLTVQMIIELDENSFKSLSQQIPEESHDLSSLEMQFPFIKKISHSPEELINLAKKNKIHYLSTETTGEAFRAKYVSTEDLLSLDWDEVFEAAYFYYYKKQFIAASIYFVTFSLLVENFFYSDDFLSPSPQQNPVHSHSAPTTLLIMLVYHLIGVVCGLATKVALDYWNEYLVPEFIEPYQFPARNIEDTAVETATETDEEEYDVENSVADKQEETLTIHLRRRI